MSKRLPLRLVSLICLVIITGVAGTGSMTQASPDSPAINPATPEPSVKLQLVSQDIFARKVEPGYPGETYIVTADYRFKNSGAERMVRFNIPLSPEKAKRSIVVRENGETVSFETGQKGNVSWSSAMPADGETLISLNYIQHPEMTHIDGTMVLGDGQVKTVTGLQNVFFSIHEQLNIPILAQDDSLVWENGPHVRIEFDPAAPDSLVTGEPSGYTVTQGSVEWQLSATDNTSSFTAGYLRIGDCLYNVGDAELLIKALTGKSYQGYITDLTRKERLRYLSIARNGIFARHGYPFESGLKDYFSELSWYKPDDAYTDSRLSDSDKEIIDLIVKAERQLK